MFPIFIAILKFCTDQILTDNTTLMSVRRKDSEVIMFYYVSDFPPCFSLANSSSSHTYIDLLRLFAIFRRR